jgi:hypothetical protein
MSLKPLAIAGGALFGVGIILFALGALTPIPYWVGAVLAAAGLATFLIAVRMMQEPIDAAASSSNEDPGVPEVGLMPTSTRTVKCPRCGTPSEVTRGQSPSCGRCGFS